MEPFTENELYLFAILLDPALGTYHIKHMLKQGTSPQERMDGDTFMQKLKYLSTRSPHEVGTIREIIHKESDPVLIMSKPLTRNTIQQLRECW